jgi:hypothetical protein
MEFLAELNISITCVICGTNHIWPVAEKLLSLNVMDNLHTADDA